MEETQKYFFQVIGATTYKETGGTALHYWAAKDDVESVKQVVSECSPSVLLLTDFCGNTLLHYAVSAGAYKIMEYIIQQFPHESFYNIHHVTPAHIAAQIGDLKAIRILDEFSGILQLNTSSGWSPLDFAIYFGRFEAVKTLFSKPLMNKIILCADSSLGTCIQHRCLRYCSPLDLAYQSIGKNSETMARFLYERGALPSFHASVVSQNFQAVTFYVSSPFSSVKGNIDVQGGIREVTALHIAASLGDFSICNYLIQSRASPDSEDIDGFSPLQHAVISQSETSLDTIKLLHPKSTTEHATAATFLAIDLGRQEFAQELVMNRVNPSAINQDGDPVLTRLIKRKLISVAIDFLSRSPPLDVVDSRGATALHYAAALSDDLTHLLLKSNVNIQALDNNGFSPLMYALFAQNYNSVIALGQWSDGSVISKIGINPYCLIASQNLFTGKIAHVGASIRVTTQTISLHFTVNLHDFDLLISEFKVPQITTSFPPPNSVSLVKNVSPAVPLIHSDFVNKITGDLVTCYRQRFGDMMQGVSTLQFAMVFGATKETLSFLLKLMPTLLDDADATGRTPIQLAAALGLVPIVELFLKENATINTQDFCGNTIYHYLIDDALNDMVVQRELNLNFTAMPISAKNHIGQVLFHSLCLNGCVQLLKYFYSICDDKSIILNADDNGLTPMDMACKCRDHVKKVACIDFLTGLGIKNPLVTAISLGDIYTAQVLLETGFPVNSFGMNKNTPLHIAASSSLPNALDMVKLLKSYGANIEAPNSDGRHPIHLASMAGNYDIIMNLLEGQYNISDIPPLKQPFYLAKDKKIKLLLYRFWKRQKYVRSLIRNVRQRKDPIQSLIQLAKDPNNPDSNIWPMVNHIGERLLLLISLICDKVETKLDYSKPINHFLQVFSTLAIDNYLYTLTAEIEPLKNYFVSKKGNMWLNILQLLSPLHAISMWSAILTELKEYLVPEIDDIDSYNEILKKIQKSAQVTSVSLGIVQTPILTSFAQTYHLPNDCHGFLYLYTYATIQNINRKSSTVFDMQQFLAFKRIFPDFSMPRYINLNDDEKVQIFFFSDELILVSTTETRKGLPILRLPILMTYIRLQSSFVYVFTTIGSFTLKVNEAAAKSIVDVYESRYEELNKFDYGESGFQTKKDKTFECSMRYLVPGMKHLALHYTVVKAGNEKECLDICYAFATNALSQPPQVLMVNTRELQPRKDLIMC